MVRGLAYNSNEMTEGQQHGRRQDPPTSVTLVNWGVFLLGLANGWRVLGLYQQSEVLLGLDPSLDTRVQMTLALVWAVLFLVMAFFLRRKQPWVRFAIPFLMLIYALYQLLFLRAFVQTAEAQGGGMAFALFYGLAILFTTWTLNSRSTRAYYYKGITPPSTVYAE